MYLGPSATLNKSIEPLGKAVQIFHVLINFYSWPQQVSFSSVQFNICNCSLTEVFTSKLYCLLFFLRLLSNSSLVLCYGTAQLPVALHIMQTNTQGNINPDILKKEKRVPDGEKGNNPLIFFFFVLIQNKAMF